MHSCQLTRRKGLKRSKKRLVRRVRIRPISAKRLAERPARRAAVAIARRRARGHCEARFSPNCNGKAQHPHEPYTRGRGGPRTDPANIVMVCRPCHRAIHREGERATAAGLLVSQFAGRREEQRAKYGKGRAA